MSKEGSSKGNSAFTAKWTLFDVGIGILYFFTSHMVIRAMFYAGLGKSHWELSCFFFIVAACCILAHVFSGLFVRFRLFIESMFGFPVVSVIATIGAVMALLSALPVTGIALFYCSGALLGLACGWIVVIWTSTIRLRHLDSSSFYVDPSLLMAVLTYFAFRAVCMFSDGIGQGFMLALPLAAFACIFYGGKTKPHNVSVIDGERASALFVLVCVACAFALGCTVVVQLSGIETPQLPSGLNFMSLFEVLAIILMLFCCGLMNRVSQHGPKLTQSVSAAIVLLICVLPMFLMGALMGVAGLPTNSPDALWESNIWVLIIAIFAYDIRESLFAVKGLALGIMFEAMCVGQILSYIAFSDDAWFMLTLGVGVAALYFASIYRQLIRNNIASQDTKWKMRGMGKTSPSNTGGLFNTEEQNVESLESEGVQPDSLAKDSSTVGEGASAMVLERCQAIARSSGLTQREVEILVLMAMGRSAKYISEELVVSYNTTRTHIRHIYEKLNIHSKQELIDYVIDNLTV